MPNERKVMMHTPLTVEQETALLTPLLSVREVSKQTRLPISSLYDSIAKGTLKAHRFGNRIRLKPQAVQAWIDSHEVTPD